MLAISMTAALAANQLGEFCPIFPKGQDSHRQNVCPPVLTSHSWDVPHSFVISVLCLVGTVLYLLVSDSYHHLYFGLHLACMGFA